MLLDRTTQIMATCHYQFTPNYKINLFIKQQRGFIGITTVNKDVNLFDGHANATNLGVKVTFDYWGIAN